MSGEIPAVRTSPDRATLIDRVPWVAVLTLLLVAGGMAWIAAHPNAPVWDQARLLEARFEAPWYPAPPFGLTAQLLVVALRPFAADGIALDWLLRSAALGLWAGAAMWLAAAVLERRALQLALLCVLFTSQYPFLWLSTELIAGGLLCLALGAWLRGAPPWVTGALLTLLALGKPDLVLVAGALFVLFAWERAADLRGMALGATAAAAALLLPGLIAFGPEYLTAYGADGGGRGFASFSQHLAALLAPLQLTPGPNPWAAPQPYVERLFPDAKSMADVIAAPGLPYLEFVSLSLAKGARKFAWTFQWGWLVLGLLVVLRRRAAMSFSSRERALAVTAVGLFPFVLLAYPHVRYLARYYPLFWLFVFLSAERLSALGEARRPSRGLMAAAAIALVALAVNVQRASLGMALAPRLELYWFPD